ncbi:MAG: glycosyltransferase [Promethearchaeota archaeon]|jgi:glycosyltransferase involved in cell wall biosynthesis
MRFHVPGLPHTVTNSKFIHCAFTQKVFKLCQMLKTLGHEVYHYGCEGSNPVCTEHVDVIEDEFRKKYYPDEWHNKQWDYNIQDKCHKLFYKNTIKAIKDRQGPHDFFLASWGWGHKPISDALANNVLTIESGIGYKDTFCRYRVFESYTWMSHVYGRGIVNEQGTRQSLENGAYFDAVIPNYFDPVDFDFNPEEKEDYFLYLGRIIKRKGIEIVLEIAKATGIHVKIAGQGKWKIPSPVRGEIIEHIGFADKEKRKTLFSKARGLLMPTIYIEPFGGVSVESLISGTPVICSDWGVFPETIPHGVVGYRCRTLDHFVWAVRNIENISPEVCRDYALKNFSLERVASMYQEYFDMVYTLWDKQGWYKINSKRDNMKWLERYIPSIEPVSESCVLAGSSRDNVENLIYPDETEPNYCLDLKWYSKPKEPGISFILRAKNEQKTIGMAIDSLTQLLGHLNLPYEINIILNQCTDNTESEVTIRQKNNPNIHLFHYPFQLGKTGLENICTPVTSIHSTVWLLNWMLMKGKYQYTFRWDADFIMTSSLAGELKEFIEIQDIVNIAAIFSDTGRANTEPYLWSNNLVPRYCRYSLWHLTRYARQSSKVITAKGKIIHDSPLDYKKDYWSEDPWWELEKRDETAEIEKKAKKKFGDLSAILGVDTGARASCPQSEELARRLHNLIGAETAEIPGLKEYASTIV